MSEWLMKIKAGYLGAILSMTLLPSCAVDNNGAEAAENFDWPRVYSAVKPDQGVEHQVNSLLGLLTLEEKIGQMIQPEIKFITPAQVKEFHIGSVLNGGGTAPNNNKFAPVSEWVALADEYYRASISSNGAGVPLIWGSDAVHGHNNVVGATLFPHNIGLGASRDVAMIKRIGAATAREVSVTGIDWTFAPTVAVVRDDRWGRTYEGYSEDPAIVREYARAMVSGVQGEGTARFDDQHVVATAKHFLGDGGTHQGIDRGDTRVTEQQLRDIHAAGFISALEAGVQTVMASFNSWNGVKIHGHSYLRAEVLKQKFGFDGFVGGDWNGHRQVPGCTVTRCAQAINAGLDMFMVPSDWQELYKNTLAQARSGEIPAARIDDAVRRILRVKVRAGLMRKGLVSSRDYAAKTGVMGSAEHRKLAREAVRKSLVLLKNNDQLLPLALQQRVLMAGSGADDIGQQSGGWTLSWQGTGNKPSDFPGATSIYQGIKSKVVAAGGAVELAADGKYKQRPDVAVVVIGEQPYAEWHGDVSSIEYQYGNKKDLALLQKLKADNIPVVTVFLSGRPLWVNKELNASTAFVAAWLPGSEGGGIADVLFKNSMAKVDFDFVGKLSYSWPMSPYQTVINKGDDNYKPLFAYGYGLNYQQATANMAQLDERFEVDKDDTLAENWIFVSRSQSPWQLYIKGDGSEPVEVDGNQAALEDNSLVISSVDKASQQDARNIIWTGVKAASVGFVAAKPLDLRDYVSTDAILQFDLQLLQTPTDAVQLQMSCGPECGANLDLSSYLGSLHISQWQNMAVKLSCFKQRGMDFSKVTSAFGLSSGGRLSLSVANIKLLSNNNEQSETANTMLLACGSNDE